ncbi:GAF domain-containing protein [Deferrisoma palaeochoriense]
MPDRTCTLPEILRRLDHPDLPWALECVFTTFNRLMAIDPNQSWRKILYDAARVIVEFLGARGASIRLYDPRLNQMVSFGSFHMAEAEREVAIPFEESVAGRVVATQRAHTVPDIESDPAYRNKAVLKHGLRSLLAVPLSIPRFDPRAPDVQGAIQIYYAEANRKFTATEIEVAQLMAQRVSYVVARKQILDLRRMNEKKEWIVERIFAKLSQDRGIKLKDLFQPAVEELQDIIRIQSCSLFAVNEDETEAVLEAGWPVEGGYHTIGKTFRLAEHPYLNAVVRQGLPTGDFEAERVHPSYLLIKDPQKSFLVTADLRQFCRTHGIHSILYVPLRLADRVRYILVFDAVDRRRFFTDEEIEILTFFGKQLTQVLEIERLDDILHDFKNPAIAVAGFARRVRRMLEAGDDRRDEMLRYLDVVIREGTRLQEMALSLYPVSRPEALDLSEVVRDRVAVNTEAIREQRRAGVETDAGSLEPELWVRVRRLALERVLDNLLNNATKAMPATGGTLTVRTFGNGDRVHVEISNPGRLDPDQLEALRAADVKGRGLGIVYRLVRSMGGTVDVEVDPERDLTTFRVTLPRHKEGP